MSLPTPKSVAAPTAPAAATPEVATANKSKVIIKQFGKARTEEDANGNTQVIPAPKPLNVDFVELSKKIHGFVKGEIEGLKIDWETFVGACALDKPSVPGHKEGRATYATANAIISLDKVYGLLTKERGIGGAAKTKQLLASKTAAFDVLRAKLMELGQSPEAIEALIAATKPA